MRRARRVIKSKNYAEKSSSDEDKPKKKKSHLLKKSVSPESKKHSRLNSSDDDFEESLNKKSFTRSSESSDDDFEEVPKKKSFTKRIQSSDDDEEPTTSLSNKPNLSRLQSTKTKQASREGDSSSSESDIENYLKRPDELNLNSTFFKSVKPKSPTFSQIEKNIFENVKQLSDSESDGEMEQVEETDGVQQEVNDIPKATFEQLNEFTRKMEEAKLHVEKYEAKKREEKKKEDIGELLTMGEKNLWDSPEIVKGVKSAMIDRSIRSSEFESFSESEKEDWEEIETNEQPPKPDVIPKNGVEITVQMPDTIRKKKGVDLVAAMKRRLNRIKKENQVYVHRVHLLCWIAHGNYVNNVLNKESLLAVALSLLPSQQCYPSERTDLKYLEGILGWFRRTISNVDKITPKNMQLDKNLMVQFNKKQAQNSKMYVFMFVCILRALGIQCRLVMSLQVEPLKPQASELHTVSTKTGEGDKKSEGGENDVKKASGKTKSSKDGALEKKEVGSKKNEKIITEKGENSKKTSEDKKLNSDGTKSSGRRKRKSVEKDVGPKEKAAKSDSTTQKEKQSVAGKSSEKGSKKVSATKSKVKNDSTKEKQSTAEEELSEKETIKEDDAKQATTGKSKRVRNTSKKDVVEKTTKNQKSGINLQKLSEKVEEGENKLNHSIRYLNLSPNSQSSSDVEKIIDKNCGKQVRIVIHKLNESDVEKATQIEDEKNTQTKLKPRNTRTQNKKVREGHSKERNDELDDKEAKEPVKKTRKNSQNKPNNSNTQKGNTSPGMRLRYSLSKIDKNLDDYVATLEDLEKAPTSKALEKGEDLEKGPTSKALEKGEHSGKNKTKKVTKEKVEKTVKSEDSVSNNTTLKIEDLKEVGKKIKNEESNTIVKSDDSIENKSTLKVPCIIDDLDMSRGSWRRSKSISPVGLRAKDESEVTDSLGRSASSNDLVDEEKVDKQKNKKVAAKAGKTKGKRNLFKIPIKQKNNEDVPQVDGVMDYSSDDDYYTDESNDYSEDYYTDDSDNSISEIPQLDGNNDDDSSPSTSKQLTEPKPQRKRHLSRLSIQKNYKEADSEEDFSPRSPFTSNNHKSPRVNLTRLQGSEVKSKDSNSPRAKIVRLEDSPQPKIKGKGAKAELKKQTKVNLEKLNQSKTIDVRNDIISLVKGRINEQKHIDNSKLAKSKRVKRDEDSDSDYAPMPVVKKLNTSKESKSKAKVKRRIPPRSVLERKVFSSDEEAGATSPGKNKKKGVDFWVEVFLENEEKWISADVVKGQVHCVKEIFSRASHPISYILAWDNTNRIKDVTKRYCSNWNTVTRKLRTDQKWWDSSLKPFIGKKNARDKEEDADLARLQLDQPLPKSIAEYKDHPLYVLPRHLLKFQAIYPPDAITLGFIRNEPVYSRDCVYTLHSREIWLKEAKQVKLGEKPYKIVKARPKWDKLSNSLIKDQLLEIFGVWQVEDYVPPTAENGIVPRNAFGNVELFKACMLPKGTVHLQLPGLNKVAKKLQIDCASAVVGFDFHSGFSHPTFDGFVVCEEFQDKIVAAWYQEQEEQEKREQEKYEKRVYGNWKRLIKGLLIRERLKARYDFGGEVTVPIPKPPEKPEGKPKGPRFIINKKKK